MNSIGVRGPPQNSYGGSPFAMKQVQAPDNYSFPSQSQSQSQSQSPFSSSTTSKVAGAGASTSSTPYTDNAMQMQSGVHVRNNNGPLQQTQQQQQQQQHEYGLYSNSNRNLITQKFAPVGIPPSSSSSYHYATTSNRDISPGFGSPGVVGNENANSNKRQSFGAGANNNIANTGLGGVFSGSNPNSQLNLGIAPPEPLSYVHISSQPISGASYEHEYKSSPVTNGTYQTSNKNNSDSDLGLPYAYQQQQQRQSGSGWSSTNPSIGSGVSRLAGLRPASRGHSDAFDSWSKSRIYDTGSTLENLQASARESVLSSVSNKWGPTRDEMKEQLASSLASDDKIRILPGFEARTQPQQTRSSSSMDRAGAPYSINYGRHEDKAMANGRSGVNANDSASQEKRPPSPVTRAQHAIGQTRRELGQVQSMMEMNGNGIGGAASSSSSGFWGLGRQARARQCFSFDAESLAMKRTKQQSYRADLERQIEQSRARKNEMRRLDEQGDHPLGVKYNSPVPHNYLDDACLRSPRNNQAPPQNVTASIVRDYTKYLELMKGRNPSSSSSSQRAKGQQAAPAHGQASRRARHPSQVQSARCAPVNLNPFSNSGTAPQSQQRQQYQTPQVSPRISPQQQQQQEQMAVAAYQAQAQQYYQAYYQQQQHPYNNGYGTPQPNSFNQYPVPASSPVTMTATPSHVPVQDQFGAPSRLDENGYARIPRENHQTPMTMTSDDFNDPYNSDMENRQALNSQKLRDNDKDERETDSADSELEQALRLHVWQESDQMPDQDLKANLYKRDLTKQIVEKRREQMERKRKEEQEDVRLEQKILEYQEQMRRELEQEKSQLNRLLEIKNRKHAASQRNQNQHSVHFGLGQSSSRSVEQNVASGRNGIAEEMNKCKTARENGGGDFRSGSPATYKYNAPNDDFDARAKSPTSALSTLTLPALARTFSARCVAAAGGGGDGSGTSRPREIVQDLKVLSNLNKILEKEAERVDHALQEKRVTPRRMA